MYIVQNTHFLLMKKHLTLLRASLLFSSSQVLDGFNFNNDIKMCIQMKLLIKCWSKIGYIALMLSPATSPHVTIKQGMQFVQMPMHWPSMLLYNIFRTPTNQSNQYYLIFSLWHLKILHTDPETSKAQNCVIYVS